MQGQVKDLVSHICMHMKRKFDQCIMPKISSPVVVLFWIIKEFIFSWESSWSLIVTYWFPEDPLSRFMSFGS